MAEFLGFEGRKKEEKEHKEGRKKERKEREKEREGAGKVSIRDYSSVGGTLAQKSILVYTFMWDSNYLRRKC